MAQERYGFFNSTAEDERSYDSADMAAALHTLASNGVANLGTCLQVTAEGSTMRTLAGYGTAMLAGYYYQLKDDGGGIQAFAHTTEAELNRIDRIILRLDLTARTIAMVKLIGTAASTPVAPVLTRDSETYEISLAQVHIGAGASEILSADITDERADDTVCGLIAPESLRRSTVEQLISDMNADVVRFSAQTLDTGAKSMARSNIDAAKGSDHKYKIYNSLDDIGVASSQTVTLQEVCVALPDNSMFVYLTTYFFTGDLCPSERNGTLFIVKNNIVGISIYFKTLVDNSLWTNYAYYFNDTWNVGTWQKIKPVTEISATAAAAGWVGSAAPYTQDVLVSGVFYETQGIVVGLAPGASDAAYEAALAALIRASGQNTNIITLRALGDKPTIDLPLLVQVMG